MVDLVAEEISDGRVLHLIRSILEAGVIDGGGWQPTRTGVPQGGVASPLWSNIFLTPFDHVMTEGWLSADALGGRLRRRLPDPSGG